MLKLFICLTLTSSVCVMTACDTNSKSIISENAKPLANTGNDRSVVANDKVILFGSGSDLDGTITTYQWKQVGGVKVLLADQYAASASFRAPETNKAISLVFQLSVTDNNLAVSTSNITIQVKPKHSTVDTKSIQIEKSFSQKNPNAKGLVSYYK